MIPMTRPVGRLLVLFVLVQILNVAGCGQKGALFLPGDPSEMQSITPAAEPGIDEADGQATDDQDQESDASNDDTGKRS